MPTQAPVRATWSRDRIWRVATLLLVGLAIHLLAPQIAELPRLRQVVRSFAWPALAAAVVCQVGSYLSSGALLAILTHSEASHVSVPRATAIFAASGSIGMVAGGLLGATAAMARWLELAGVPRGDAVAANPIIVQLENLILVGVAAFGLVHLLVKHALTPTVAASFAVVLAGVMLLIVLLGYRSGGIRIVWPGASPQSLRPSRAGCGTRGRLPPWRPASFRRCKRGLPGWGGPAPGRWPPRRPASPGTWPVCT